MTHAYVTKVFTLRLECVYKPPSICQYQNSDSTWISYQQCDPWCECKRFFLVNVLEVCVVFNHRITSFISKLVSTALTYRSALYQKPVSLHIPALGEAISCSLMHSMVVYSSIIFHLNNMRIAQFAAQLCCIIL